MPLELHRRHLTSCIHRSKGKNHTQCQCPVWVDGPHPVTQQRVRRSIGTRDWARAKKLLDRWESDERSIDTPQLSHPTVAIAIDKYIDDCKRRKLGEGTVRNYSNSLAQFARFIEELPAPGVPDVFELKLDHIRDFSLARSQAPGRREEFTSSRTLRKELEHLRAFCAFCVDNEWMAKNQAKKVKPPKDTSAPTLPFEPAEVQSLLKAIDMIDNHNYAGVARARLRARGLVLLLLYSGMRIADATMLRRDRIDSSGRLLIRMEKTGQPLYVRLPEVVLTALRLVPHESDYFFWSGECERDTAVGSARRTIACLARHTKIHAHPHRFRDTFAVELLKSGVDIFTVQKLLGHTSIKTTQKHYAPWVTAFQDQLDAATAKLSFAA